MGFVARVVIDQQGAGVTLNVKNPANRKYYETDGFVLPAAPFTFEAEFRFRL